MALYRYVINVPSASTVDDEGILTQSEKYIGEFDAISLLDIQGIVPEALVFQEATAVYDASQDEILIEVVYDKKIPREVKFREAGILNYIQHAFRVDVSQLQIETLIEKV